MESVHRGSIAVVSAGGRLLASAGDPHQAVWLRSSAKPFQLVPFLAAGGERRFSLSTREIALAAASHSGQPVHARLAERMLAKGGFSERDLHCGAHPPMHLPSARALVRSGKAPRALHNNCSGKHAAMLLACRLLGLPPRTYWKPGHPLQRRILATVARLTGVAPGRVGVAVDGCSVPVFRVPLAGLALGYARLLAPRLPDEDPAEAAARRRIAAAMKAAPGMVAGTGRFTTFLMRSTGAGLVGKEGAEGVYAVAARRRGRESVGIALKIEDGSERPRDAIVVEVLRQLRLVSRPGLARLTRFADRPVRNVRGDVAGDGLPARTTAREGVMRAVRVGKKAQAGLLVAYTAVLLTLTLAVKGGGGVRTNLAPFEDISRILLRAGHGGVLSNAFVYAVVGIVGNLAMFALFAFLLWKFLDGPGRSPARNHVDVILVGTMFSLGIESIQLFLPTRAADINDVFWNVLGTIAGSLAAHLHRNVRFEWE